MKPYLKFGGPNLPLGTHTWFYDRELPLPGEESKYNLGTTRVEPGEVVATKRIVDPEYYVQTQRAVECDFPDGTNAAPEVAADKD